MTVIPLTLTPWRSVLLEKSVVVNLVKKIPTFNGTGRFSTVKMMMETVSTSETSVNFYETTRRNILEDSRLLTRRRENLKSQAQYLVNKTLSLIPILNQMNPVHIHISYLFKISFKKILPSMPGSPVASSRQVLRLKVCTHFSSLPFALHATLM
jgi:hypothetical protein